MGVSVRSVAGCTSSHQLKARLSCGNVHCKRLAVHELLETMKRNMSYRMLGLPAACGQTLESSCTLAQIYKQASSGAKAACTLPG